MKMRFFVFLTVITFFLISCGGRNSELINPDVVSNPASAESEKAKPAQPVFRFDRTEHDFGRLIDGEKVSYSFRFVNDGNADLLIAQAKGSCGCTVPSFPQTPIKPGEEGFIEITFDTSGRPGFQSKTVTVIANTVPATVVLTVKANIEKL